MTNPVVVLLSRLATSRPVCSLEPPGLGRSPLRLDKCNHLISRAASGAAKTNAAKAHDETAAASAHLFFLLDRIFTVTSLPARISSSPRRDMVHNSAIETQHPNH